MCGVWYVSFASLYILHFAIPLPPFSPLPPLYSAISSLFSHFFSSFPPPLLPHPLTLQLSRLYAHTTPQIGGRFVIGVGVGLASSIAPLYIQELSPTRQRGRMVVLNVAILTLGQVIAYGEWGLLSV